ncbi:MAG: hypothetical protein UX75_C0036G0034 [Candidatus Moranbacteria bacterium GW2011_GWE2_47_10]|nr:MAG: hypothetical protein UX75_C0036G0034 [Candidatus Moranbacteria bacterium GW2011_GWE2_47_10]
MAYKQIDERFWKDKKIKKLSKDGYILFLYLLTSPHTHFSGLSEMSLDYVNIDTPLSENESKAAYKELCMLGLIQYDPEHEIVWIKNMHKYQIKSAKQKKGAETQIQNLPRSVLCKNLAEILNIPYPYPIHTLFNAENTLPIQEEAKAKEEVTTKATTKEEAKKHDVVFEIPEELNTPDFLKTWQDWQEHLKEKNAKTTNSAFKKQLEKLSIFGLKKALHTINFCIEKNWQGIYEDANYADEDNKQADSEDWFDDGPDNDTLAAWEVEAQEFEGNKCK